MKRTRRAMQVDRAIGRNIRRRLRLLGMSPERLASRLKLSGYALHRVLTGQDRLNAARLYDASLWLGLPVVAFFDGLD